MRLKVLSSVRSLFVNGYLVFSLLIVFAKNCTICKFNQLQQQKNDILPVVAQTSSKRYAKKFTFKYKAKLCYLTFCYNHKNDELNAIETIINP